MASRKTSTKKSFSQGAVMKALAQMQTKIDKTLKTVGRIDEKDLSQGSELVPSKTNPSGYEVVYQRFEPTVANKIKRDYVYVMAGGRPSDSSVTTSKDSLTRAQASAFLAKKRITTQNNPTVVGDLITVRDRVPTVYKEFVTSNENMIDDEVLIEVQKRTPTPVKLRERVAALQKRWGQTKLMQAINQTKTKIDEDRAYKRAHDQNIGIINRTHGSDEATVIEDDKLFKMRNNFK